MANKTLLAQIKQRSDTAANWTAKNPIISDGELIIVTTNAGEKRFKVGDGEKTFTQLPYADENILSKIKNYTAGDGISISDTGVISSTGGGSGSDVFVIEFTYDNGNITGASKTFEETKQAIESNKIVAISNIISDTNNELNFVQFQFYAAATTESPIEEIILKVGYNYILNHTVTIVWDKASDGTETYQVIQDEGPVWVYNDSTLSNSGAAYWNASNRTWEIKDIASSSDTLNPIVLDIGTVFPREGSTVSITSASATEIWNAYQNGSAFYIKGGAGCALRLLEDYSAGSSGNDHHIEFYDLWIRASTYMYLDRLVWQSNNNTLTLQKRTKVQLQYKAGKGISISDDGTISVTTATYYTGTADPVNTLGADGDLYLKTEG